MAGHGLDALDAACEMDVAEVDTFACALLQAGDVAELESGRGAVDDQALEGQVAEEAECLVWIVRLIVLVHVEQKGLSRGALPVEADVAKGAILHIPAPPELRRDADTGLPRRYAVLEQDIFNPAAHF